MARYCNNPAVKIGPVMDEYRWISHGVAPQNIQPGIPPTLNLHDVSLEDKKNLYFQTSILRLLHRNTISLLYKLLIYLIFKERDTSL
jgi:hypothetical protein